MGIPAFYRWLVSRYPKAAVDVIEEKSTFVNGVRVPIDTTQPNPNGYEIDNLYLDMNGIVHPCFHPEDLTAPKTYDEVFKAVFKYIDRIFSIVRPRKLLYLAIDGVAPRAKMNQQRARRFRAAKDAADEASETETPSGIHEPEVGNVGTEKLDSNVITPGTEFMEMLSSALRYYMHLKMNEDPGWQGIKVILSDATVPGEGEHKIMSYIRLQRNLPGFNPNTCHCLYGLDADLIMLALATHEIHFSILREDIRKVQTNSKRVKKGEDPLPFSENVENVISRQKFQFLNIWVLRDYLAHDLRVPDPTVNSDLERLIDDFVFMCLFVGNDFLPHVPSLEISEGAIDLLMFVYKKEFVQMGGYLTNSFEVNLDRVEQFVQAVGLHENAIFRKRSEVNKQMEIRFRRSLTNPRKERATSFRGSASNSNKKKIWKSPSNMVDNGSSAIDKVKLGEEGYKERYYTEKFEVKTDADIEKIQRHAVMIYIEGICWVMHYYYQGVCSWQWFYPYHYAPFASDFYGLNHLEIHFTLGKPFKPFDQLMGVLPAASAQALPLSYRKLMTDPSSAILDFYPSDFELDMNGKRLAWQAICKLPFIDESRLLSEIAKVESTLTDEEKQRNSLGLDILFVHITHPLAVKIFSFYERNKDNPKLFKAKVKKKINPKFSDGMNGFIYITDKPVSPMEIFSPVDDMEIITNNKVISVLYQYPSFHSHIPKPPEGVIIPEKFVSEQDLLPQPILWHEKSAIFGRKFSERPPNPKSIWGPSLAKLAHRLVSEYYFAKQQQTMDGINSSCINGEDRMWKCGKDWDEPTDNKIKKKNNRKNRKRTKPRAIKDVCTEGYFDWKERMVQQSNGCDGPMDTKDDDQTENKIQKKREKYYKSNFAEQQATTDGTGNYINGEDRMKQQCNDCDGPMDTKGDDQTENKIQKKRKKRRKSNFAEQQATTNGIVGNYINGEDRMKQRSNDCDDPKFAEQQKTTDGVRKKSINDEDRMKPQRNDCDDPKFAEQQNTTDGVGEKSMNGEDRMKPQSNNCNDPTDNIIGNKKRRKRRGSEFAEQQATTDGVSETHMNCEDRMKPQGDNCGSSADNKTEKKKRKKRRRKFEEKQSMVDGVGENCINGEEKMKQLSNNCDDPTDNKIEKKRKKRRSKKRKIEANVEKGNEAEVMESLLTGSATLTLSADSSSRKFCLQDIMEGGTINQQKCLEA